MPTSTQVDQVRLLIGDMSTPQLFSDTDLQSLVDLEGGNVKRAAAQAIDTIASSEVLVSKVIKTQDLQTDGAKVADALRKHAAALRDQALVEDESGDGYFVDVIEAGPGCVPELTEWPYVGIC